MKKEKVLVIGAARSGIAVTDLLLNSGFNVVLTDNRKPSKIFEEFPNLEEKFEKLQKDDQKRLELVFGEQFDPERIDEFSFIVTSPGVPETVPVIMKADKEGIEILSEPEISYRLNPDVNYIAITGTNGKTTTTTLTGEIFKNSGLDTYVVGNIGDPISNYVLKADENSYFITEIGSFQLSRSYNLKPRSAVILNITPDHLDRHKTMENYINAKARIFQSQDENDVIILNADDPNVKDLANDLPVRKLYISLEDEVTNGAFLKDSILYIKDNDKILELISIEDLGIKGLHNVQNALAASLLAYSQNIPIQTIKKTLKEFKGVEHRQEDVGIYNGIKYVNDSKGTNTDASIIAIDAMDRPIVLIAGGYDKKEDYTNFAHKIKEKVKKVVLLGDTAKDINRSLVDNDYNNVIFAQNFEEAVELAKKEADQGDVVLLSPACASWDMFDNFEQRGDLFKKLVKEN